MPYLILEIKKVGIFSGFGFHVGDVLAHVLADKRPLGNVGSGSNTPTFALSPKNLSQIGTYLKTLLQETIHR